MAALRAAAMGLAELMTFYDQYQVPEYQRVYGWGEVEISRLFSDVERAMRPGAPHFFLGTIYLAAAPDERVAQIADGQQRMLTAMIAYAVARDLSADNGDASRLKQIVAGPVEGRFRFVPRESDAAFFARWVQEPGATLKPFTVARGAEAEPQPEEAIEDPELGLSESQVNIIANRDQIAQSLRQLPPAELARLFDFLAKETSVVVITARTLEDARNAYASTQTRGLRQSETDKLKAELIADCPAAVRARLAGQWEECEAILGKEDLAELLQHMIVIRTERKPQHAIDVDLFKAFDLPKGVEHFISQELVPDARAYRRLCEAAFDGNRMMRRIRGHLVTLRRATHATWKAPALLALRVFENDPAALEVALRRLERFVTVLMIRGTDPNLVLDRYIAIIREMKAAKSPEIPALDISPAERADARRLIADPRFGTRERFRMPLLLKLNDLMAGEVLAVDPKTVSCEHILPRNVAPNSPWRSAFKPAEGRRYEGGKYVQQLGNLTVLGHVDNRLADTLPFLQKRPIFKRSPLAIANDVGKNRAWTPEIVQARTARLARMLEQHWDL